MSSVDSLCSSDNKKDSTPLFFSVSYNLPEKKRKNFDKDDK
jgi:hypothetical protein